jgi:hypothetical protein
MWPSHALVYNSILYRSLLRPIPNRPRNIGKTQIKQYLAWPRPAQAFLTPSGRRQVLNLFRPSGPPEPPELMDSVGCDPGLNGYCRPGPDQQDLPQHLVAEWRYSLHSSLLKPNGSVQLQIGLTSLELLPQLYAVQRVGFRFCQNLNCQRLQLLVQLYCQP